MAGTITDNVLNVLGGPAGSYRADEPAEGIQLEIFLTPPRTYYASTGFGFGPRKVAVNQTSGAFTVSLTSNSLLVPTGSAYRLRVLYFGKELTVTDPFQVFEDETHTVAELLDLSGTETNPPPGPDPTPTYLYTTFSNTNYVIPTNVRAVASIAALTANRTVQLPLAAAVPAGDDGIITVMDRHGSASGAHSIIVTQKSGSGDLISNGLFSIRTLDTAYAWEQYVSDGVSTWFALAP